MNVPDRVIETLLGWIDDNLGEPLRIDTIAAHVGYSKWHLQRLFMQYTGESLGRYVRQIKLQRAANDLCHSDDKIVDISVRYGFDSQQTFTRIFTRTYRQSPGRYRKSKREGG